MSMKICNDRKKKGLFNTGTKFSHYKVLHWKGVGYRNKKNSKIHKWARHFGTFNTRIK